MPPREAEMKVLVGVDFGAGKGRFAHKNREKTRRILDRFVDDKGVKYTFVPFDGENHSFDYFGLGGAYGVNEFSTESAQVEAPI